MLPSADAEKYFLNIQLLLSLGIYEGEIAPKQKTL